MLNFLVYPTIRKVLNGTSDIRFKINKFSTLKSNKSVDNTYKQKYLVFIKIVNR